MKIAGIIGGIAPESTVQYYRGIVATYQDQTRDGSYPALIINSIDMSRMLGLIGALPQLTEFLLGEIGRLARAGAGFGVLASNAPHIVFTELRRRSPIPLISIVEAACAAAREAGLTRLGLFGARFTMEGSFYPEVFGEAGMQVVRPQPEELEFIHAKYFGEMAKGIFLAETRDALLDIALRMRKRDGIDGLILGGTELSLILPAEHEGLPFLDTIKIHVEQIVSEMLRT